MIFRLPDRISRSGLTIRQSSAVPIRLNPSEFRDPKQSAPLDASFSAKIVLVNNRVDLLNTPPPSPPSTRLSVIVTLLSFASPPPLNRPPPPAVKVDSPVTRLPLMVLF